MTFSPLREASVILNSMAYFQLLNKTKIFTKNLSLATGNKNLNIRIDSSILSFSPTVDDLHSCLPSSKAVVQRCQTYNLIKKETLAQLFSCEFCEISKNTFFYRTRLVAASASSKILCSMYFQTIRRVVFKGLPLLGELMCYQRL